MMVHSLQIVRWALTLVAVGLWGGVFSADGLPARFDARERGWVTSVKNQTASTCWASSAIATLEGNIRREGGDAFDFSENDLVWRHNFDWNYQQGGNGEFAAAYFLRWDGPILEDSKVNLLGLSQESSTTSASAPAVCHVQNVRLIPRRRHQGDNDALKRAIMEYGAVMSDFSFNSSCLNPNTGGYYFANGTALNHSICLVGWDDDYSAGNFTQRPSRNGAFIAKNSWGEDWCDGGYCYISYCDVMLGCSENFAFPRTESVDNYARVYQHDPLGYVATEGFGTKFAGRPIWMANLFTAVSNEMLTAAGFYVLSSNVEYEISVFTGARVDYNPKGGPDACLLSGVCASYTRGVIDAPSYSTIRLARPVYLTAGKKFYVQVKLSNPEGLLWPIAVETRDRDYSSQAVAKKGESFICADLPGNYYWNDIGMHLYDGNGTESWDGENCCIKAYTAGPGESFETYERSNVTEEGQVEFAATEMDAAEGQTVSVPIVGGSVSRPSSVQVFLGSGPASAADLDVNATVVDGKKAKKVTFPVTLSWGKGDCGSVKTIVLKIKKDADNEGFNEFLTLQLGNERGLLRGARRTCRIHVFDASTTKLTAKVVNPKKTKGVAKRHIDVVVDHSEGGQAVGAGNWYVGAKLTVKAKAQTGYAFLGWYQGERKLSAAANYTFTVKNDVALEARFGRRRFLRVLADPPEAGTQTGAGWYVEGTNVAISAKAKAHYRFCAWYAADEKSEDFVDWQRPISTDAATRVEIKGDSTVYAVYDRDPRIEVVASNAGGSVSGSGLYAVGAKVTLKAKNKKGYAFVGWYVDGEDEPLSLNPTYSFVMGADDRRITARFLSEKLLAKPVVCWNAPTNLIVGVAHAAKPTAKGEALMKVASVSFSPKGKGLVWKSGKVSGAPTSVKTYKATVKVTLASNAKKYWKIVVPLTVASLPTWAKGAFVGGSSSNTLNQTTFAISSAGKPSGKINMPSGVWTLTGSSYSSLTEQDATGTGTLKVKAKCGKKSKTLTLKVEQDALGGYVESTSTGHAFLLRQNAWAKDAQWQTWAGRLNGVVVTNAVDGLVARFSANGVAKASIKSGKYTYTASSVLRPDAMDEKQIRGLLHFYFAPNKKRKFKGALKVMEVVLPQSQNSNP